MIAILRKDAAAGLLPLLVLWPVIAIAEILKVGGMDLGLVLFNSVLLVLLTVGSVLVNEIEEETNGGYKVFAGLPTHGAEIVSAKFLGAFLLTLAFATSHLAMATLWCTDPDRAFHIRTAILSSGVLSLSIVGVLFVGVFSLGLAKAMSVLGISFWLVSA
ncbi:ABC-2 transporter permease, partial [Gemmatimonadota bacterium]